MADLGVKVSEIMASRERNDAWAVPVEEFLHKEIDAVFDAMMFGYEDLSLHCTDLACEVSFTVESEIADEAFGRMQGFPAPLQQPFTEILPDGRERIGMRFLYESSWSSIEGFRRGYRELYEQRFPDGLAPVRDWFARGGTVDSPPPEDIQ